ncbi:MAG: hypothetical protein KAX42_06555, partial [Sphaerotilus sp.]|nr:hypothetical protein [Sphaerotilus sp.]
SGMFQRVQAPGVAVSQFTQAEVDAGQVVFEQAVDQVKASFVLSLSDGEGVVGPRQVVVQVKPTLLAAPPALEVPPSAQAPGGGFADLASPQGGGLPLVGDVRSAVTASDGVPSTRTELTETGSDALVIPNRSAVSPRPAGSAASGGPGGGPRTASVTGSMVLALDASRQSTSEMLVMLDVPIDLSGFAQERVALLQWNLADASTHAAADAARQQQDREEAPLLQWDSGTTVQVGSMALSVGLVFWATRATGLVASLLAVAPPWRAFDPLPVLSVHAPRQPEGPEVEWLDTDITGSLAELAEDILDQRP